MRTLRLDGGSSISVVEVPDPHPVEGEVVIQTAVSALCGSELHTYRGKGRETGNSGHEAAGTVLEIGPGVTSLTVGQRVGLSGVVGCGHCEYCAKGQYTWCENRLPYGDMHAERILTAAHGCHVLPDDVPWDVGVLITGDGFGVPYHASNKIADAWIGTVAIFGAGPIGLGNVLMQSHLGREVIAVDVTSARLDLAKKLGAQNVVDATQTDSVAEVRRLTRGYGADACIEAAGRPETLKQCFAAVRTNGKVVMIGEQPSVDLSPSEDFIRRDISASGSWFYHFCEFPEMLRLYREGLPVANLVTHRYPFEQAGEAFREFAAGRTGKVILTMSF